MRPFSELMQQLNGSLADFIQLELRTGLMFASLAASSGPNHQKRIRNTNNARVAYEGALRFLGRADLLPGDAEKIAMLLQELKAVLAQLAQDRS